MEGSSDGWADGGVEIEPHISVCIIRTKIFCTPVEPAV